MKYSLKYIMSLLIIITAFSCGKKAGINGTIEGAENMTIYFDQISIDQTTQSLGQTTAGSSGSFYLEIPEGIGTGLYRVRIGARSVELLLDGTETNIDIAGSLESIGRLEHTVTGSANTEEYLGLMKSFISKELDSKALQAKLTSDASPMPASLVAMKVFQTRPEFSELHLAIADKLDASNPGINFTTKYRTIANQLKVQADNERAQQKVRLGEIAPDIALPNLDGKTMKLSDLKGSIVLIDFWASWCGPCRKANPHVVEMYKKYKKDGFTVFSVSLDGLDSRTKSRFKDEAQIKQQMAKSKDRWKNAIEKDKLTWDYHVSDLKKWESEAAAMYGVRSIPKTFLLDRDGRIAALNPRHDLEAQIKKLL